MRYESIIPQANGSKIKAIVIFYDNDYSKLFEYHVELLKCDKGKRTWYRPYDEDSYFHRGLSMTERRENIKAQVIDILGKYEYNKLLIEAWYLLKPELL